MVDLNSRFGRHVNRRLRREQIIWLTTVDVHNRPQPRPVWFHWDGETILIFSEKDKAKLRHIRHHRSVALNLNTDTEGGDVAVIVSDAQILSEPPAPKRMRTYIKKYANGIKSLDMTPAEFRERYAVPILVTPQALRGFVE